MSSAAPCRAFASEVAAASSATGSVVPAFPNEASLAESASSLAAGVSVATALEVKASSSAAFAPESANAKLGVIAVAMTTAMKLASARCRKDVFNVSDFCAVLFCAAESSGALARTNLGPMLIGSSLSQGLVRWMSDPTSPRLDSPRARGNPAHQHLRFLVERRIFTRILSSAIAPAPCPTQPSVPFTFRILPRQRHVLGTSYPRA